MNRNEKTRARDRRAWIFVTALFVLTAVLGLLRLMNGTGDITMVIVPAALAAGSWYMSRWTNQKHFGRKK